MERDGVGRMRREESWWLPLLGQSIDRWEVIEVLGQGGMSVVFRARHLWLDHEAAIKLLSPEMSNNETIQERFQQEARTLSRFDHPHILTILDFGLDAEHGYFMVLEYLKGHDLRHWMRRGPIPKSLLVPLFSQLCEALEVAHQAGVIHRDIKPSNLFVLASSKEPRIKLLDFGVAKLLDIQRDKELTTTGMIMGTPAYLAPEQLKPKARLSPATDLYALGVILFEILSGRLPLNGADVLEHAMLVVAQAPPRLGQVRPSFAGTPIESLIDDLLQKDPERRPSSVSIFRQRLQHALKDLDEHLWAHALPSNDALQETAKPSAAWAFALQETDTPHPSMKETDTPHPSMKETDTPHPSMKETDTPHPFTKDIDTSRFSEKDAHPSPLSVQHPALWGSEEEETSLSLRGSVRGWFVWGMLLVIVGLGAVGWFVRPQQGRSLENKRLRREASPVRAARSSAKAHSAESTKGVGETKSVGEVGERLGTSKANGGGAGKTSDGSSFRELRDSDSLYQRALRVAEKKDNKQKIAAWRAYLDHPTSSTHWFFWEARKQLSEAYEQQGWLDAAVAELRLFLASPKGDVAQKTRKASDADLMRLVRLGVRIKQAHREAAKWFAAFRRHVSEKQWFLAHAAYKRLQTLVPSAPSFQLEMGRLLGEPLPCLGVWHGERILRWLSLDAAQRREVEGMLLSWKQAQQKKQTQLRASLRRAEREARKGRWGAAEAVWKALIEEASFGFRSSRIAWMDGVRSLVASAPRAVLSAWLLYEAGLGRVERDGLGLWIKMESADFPSLESLRQQTESLRLYHQFAEAMAEINQAEASGDLHKAQGFAEKAERAWKQFQLLDTWGLARGVLQHYQRLQSAASVYTRGVVLERAYQKALREGKRKQANAAKEGLRLLVEGTTLQEPMQRRFLREDEHLRVGLRWLANGDLAYRKKQWKVAHDAYRSYLRQVPQAWNRRQITQRIKSCGCALGYPWVSCRKTDFPKK